jgi:magnesium-transporting ATPase (P-type)
VELQQKPQMKRMRKMVMIGFFFAFIVSAIVGYFSDAPLRLFQATLVPLLMIVAAYAIAVEYKVNKGINMCDYVERKYYFAMFAVIGVFALIIVRIFGK